MINTSFLDKSTCILFEELSQTKALLIRMKVYIVIKKL